MQDDLDPKALQYVLKLISNSIKYGNSRKFVYDFTLFNEMETFGVPSNQLIISVLEWLEWKNVLKFTVRENIAIISRTPIRNAYKVSQELRQADSSYIIEVDGVKGLNEFRKLYENVFGKEVVSLQNRPAYCHYNPETGQGSANGKDFVLTRKNKRLFDALYEVAGNPLARSKVLKIIEGGGTRVTDNTAAMSISTYVGNLRHKTGLNREQITVKNGNVTLNVRKQIIAS